MQEKDKTRRKVLIGLTDAPDAFAFALGFHAAIKGVAAKGMPESPTALVRPIKTFLLVLSFSCISLWVAL